MRCRCGGFRFLRRFPCDTFDSTLDWLVCEARPSSWPLSISAVSRSDSFEPRHTASEEAFWYSESGEHKIRLTTYEVEGNLYEAHCDGTGAGVLLIRC